MSIQLSITNENVSLSNLSTSTLSQKYLDSLQHKTWRTKQHQLGNFQRQEDHHGLPEKNTSSTLIDELEVVPIPRCSSHDTYKTNSFPRMSVRANMMSGYLIHCAGTFFVWSYSQSNLLQVPWIRGFLEKFFHNYFIYILYYILAKKC